MVPKIMEPVVQNMGWSGWVHEAEISKGEDDCFRDLVMVIHLT